MNPIKIGSWKDLITHDLTWSVDIIKFSICKNYLSDQLLMPTEIHPDDIELLDNALALIKKGDDLIYNHRLG
jgi:hypothetical protein